MNAHVQRRIIIAEREYGPLASSHEALGVACEEWDEFRAAIHANDLASAADEALDLAAVLIRFAEQAMKPSDEFARRSGAKA